MLHAQGMRFPARLLAALAVSLPLAALATDPPLRVVDAVDLTQYAGRWYEAAQVSQQVSGSMHG